MLRPRVTVTPVGVGGNEHLREPVAGAAGHEEVVGHAGRLDVGLLAVQHDLVAVGRRR